jgi:Rod binding domain-containing protein
MTLDAVTIQIRTGHWRDTLAGKLDPGTDSGSPDSAKTRLKGAVKDLEALLFYEMLKEMRQTTQGGFLGKGMGNDIYTSLFDMEIAKVFAERGLGLGDLILKQINNRKSDQTPSPSGSTISGEKGKSL